MDVARAPRKKTGRYIAWGGGAIVTIGALVWASTLKGAVPTVSWSVVVEDTVRRGPLVLEVRGPGTLVPEHIRWITAQASARVDNVIAQSGQSVAEGAALVEMSNPDVQINTMQADQSLNQAR